MKTPRLTVLPGNPVTASRSAASICKYPGMFQLFEKYITLTFKLYQHLLKPTLNQVIFP